MAGLPKMMRWLLLLSYAGLFASLGLQRLEGGFTGNWSLVLMSFVVFNLALGWEHIIHLARK
ncbi:hypothetical protein [Sphingobium lactosutens]|uniref:hypothetical protein n=1 Tax=Sphingobium lactosutens TaxID=522773 RepID=UPI0015B83070|nr:hypothetical protein [Sphingobium lactosutens]